MLKTSIFTFVTATLAFGWLVFMDEMGGGREVDDLAVGQPSSV